MECYWIQPSVDEMKKNLSSDDVDIRYIAAIIIRSGDLNKVYDPLDQEDPGNQQHLAPSMPTGSGIWCLGGRIYISYSRLPDQPAHLRILFEKQKTMTKYLMDFAETDLPLYSCACCIGRTRGIMRAITERYNGEYPAIKKLEVLKRKIRITFAVKPWGQSKICIAVDIPKVRPTQTIKYER